MEGINIDDNYPSDTQPYPEQQQYPVQLYPERKKDGTLPLVIGIIIGLILGIAISPFIMDILSEPDTPIYQHYNVSTGYRTTAYRNQELNVTITKWYNYAIEGYCYHAEWIDIYENYDETTQFMGSPMAAYDWVLDSADKLSENQLKWFDYMLHEIIT